MQIIKIESISDFKIFGATVNLDYDELRDLSNALYEIGQNEKWSKNPNFLKVQRNFNFLFDIVKNSAVDNWTFETANKITQKMKEAEKALKGHENNDTNT